MRMRLPFCALGLLISGTMFLAITNIDPKTMVRFCSPLAARFCVVGVRYIRTPSVWVITCVV